MEVGKVVKRRSQSGSGWTHRGLEGCRFAKIIEAAAVDLLRFRQFLILNYYGFCTVVSISLAYMTFALASSRLPCAGP